MVPLNFSFTRFTYPSHDHRDASNRKKTFSNFSLNQCTRGISVDNSFPASMLSFFRQAVLIINNGTFMRIVDKIDSEKLENRVTGMNHGSVHDPRINRKPANAR